MDKSWLVSRQAIVAMMATYALTMVMLFEQAQWWVIGIGGLCVAWRWSTLLGKSVMMKPLWRKLLTVASIVLLTLLARQIGLMHVMVNLLLLGYGLKFIELHKARDAFVLSLVGLLCVSIIFIFNSEITTALAAGGLILLNFVVLVAVCAPTMKLSKQLLLSFKVIGLSLPLMVVLFVVMPQLAPMWKMPSAKAATTGLGDSMSPGDIAQLSQSASLAFSVTFDDGVPPRDQLYWRALVMEQFDGRRWQQSNSSKLWQRTLSPRLDWPATHQQQLGDGISYQIMAKASHQSWLFGLALPTTREGDIVQTLDFNLVADKPLAAAKAYQVTSYPQLMSQLPLSAGERATNLQLPVGTNKRTKAWVSQLRGQYDDQQLIDYVLAHFNTNPFHYTLKPPLLGRDSVDDFLFDTKRGFCSHYASAFALIMRNAGIPTRIVAGYLGGEWNSDIGYLNVYQYDAHAWNEVWLVGKGWVRVDPTASVAPDRVERGLAQSLNEQDFLSESLFSLAKYQQSAWLNALRIKLANIEYYWGRWLLGYNKDIQFQVLEYLIGQLTQQKLIAFTLLCFGVISCWLLYAGGFRLKRLTPQQKIDRRYFDLVGALTKAGVVRQRHVTPIAYQQVVIERYPKLSQQITAITSRYNHLRYKRQRAVTSQDVAAFKQLTRSLLNKI